MKFLIVAALLLCSIFCYAQKQNVYLLKNNGEEVSVKDSADFIRIVREPAEGEPLYNVLDYYLDGKKKLIGKSITVEPVRLEGACLSFFQNGQRRSIATYHAGSLINNLYQYFPNGKVYLVKQYPAVTPYPKTIDSIALITEAYDSLGVAKVTDRNGYHTGYNDDFTEITEEGPVVNGKRDGDWKGTDKKDSVTFVEKYKGGILLAGTAVKNGRIVTYSKARVTRAEYPGGDAGFGMFLSRTVRYPANARESNAQGTVVLKFYVEKDGAVTNVKVVNSVEKSLDDEAARVVRSSKKWIPATKYGMPIRIYYTVPIGFALARR